MLRHLGDERTIFWKKNKLMAAKRGLVEERVS